MNIEKKYELRKRKEAYSYEEKLIDDINIYEYFDGNKALWGVKEAGNDNSLCRCTPPMEVIVDNEGKDVRRVFPLDNGEYIIYGRENETDILYRVNIDSKLETKFYKKEDFDGEDLKVQFVGNNIALIKYKNRFFYQRLYVTLNDFKPCSNVLDVVTKRQFFLKSYNISKGTPGIDYTDCIRLFGGVLEDDGITVKKYGYDFDKDKIIKFPLTTDGLIDEDKMKEYVKTTISCYRSAERYEGTISWVNYLNAEPKIRKANNAKAKVYKK